MSGIAENLARRMRTTGWTLLAVIVALFLGAACFILKNGHKSRTVLHSEAPSPPPLFV
jgi:hypothetical protein